MYYIFNEQLGTCYGTCSGEPDAVDLASRGEIAIASANIFDLRKIVLRDGKIVEVQLSIDELKAAKLEQINVWAQQAITGGFVSTCTGSPIKFDSDVDTQITVQGIALNAASERFVTEYPQGCPCRGYDENSNAKSVHMLTGEQVLGFCADLSLHIGQCKQIGWKLQELVSVTESVEELKSIVWPQV